MADSTVSDISKMKVVDLRKELKSRGLSHVGDKAELVARLQAAMHQDSTDEHADINLDSDEIDSDGVLDDDKSQNDFDDTAVETLSEDLVLADQPPVEKPAPPPAPVTETKTRTIKRKIVAPDTKEKSEEKEQGGKKFVLNKTLSVTSTQLDLELAKANEKKSEPTEGKVKINASLDLKTRKEMRAKRFGLPVQMSDAERKEARKQRFGTNTNVMSSSSILGGGTLSENMEKLKKRAERFGQSVSKIMTDIENKEKLEKRKAKFGVK